MKAPAIPFSSSLLALAITASGNALAQQTESDTDKAFIAKVSQGGLYEVEASNLALQKKFVRRRQRLTVHLHGNNARSASLLCGS